MNKIRGHSTTTWTRRGGGGVSKKSTLVHPGGGGGSLDVHVDRKLKETIEKTWQMTRESLIILHLLFSSNWIMQYIEKLKLVFSSYRSTLH